MSDQHEECGHCAWWKRVDRPHETFVYLMWEWDIDRLRKLKPIEEGEVDVSRYAECVDYPQEPGKISVTKVSVVEMHIDHVSLDEPILIGLLSLDGKVFSMLMDGHHRLARAIKEKCEKIKYKLYSVKQVNKVCLTQLPVTKKRKR